MMAAEGLGTAGMGSAHPSAEIAAVLKKLRRRVKSSIARHTYETAAFWADKAVTLSNGDPTDRFGLAQTYFHTRQYQRAIHLLTADGLASRSAACRYLTANCFFELKNYEGALDLLEGRDDSAGSAVADWFSDDGDGSTAADAAGSAGAGAGVGAASSTGGVARNLGRGKLFGSAEDVSRSDGAASGGVASRAVDPVNWLDDDDSAQSEAELRACEELLKGKLYEASGKRVKAAACYKNALALDVYCFEALSLLTTRHMLTVAEEHQLVRGLPFEQQCDAAPGTQRCERATVECSYWSKLKQQRQPGAGIVSVVESLPQELSALRSNLDIVVARAEMHLHLCEFHECFKITSTVMEQDPFHQGTLPLHIVCLVEFGMTNKLFYLAHQLVNAYPEKPVSWYAIGCYYHSSGMNAAARQYFSKATSADPNYGAAWVGYGHAFAVEGEHDQALAAFCTASRLIAGSHLPLLFIGAEYVHTNNLALAEQYFHQALTLCSHDPLLYHELGAVCFRQKQFAAALAHFAKAVELIESQSSDGRAFEFVVTWEPMLCNLGHTHRRLGQYEEAIACYERALALCPRNAKTHATMGVAHHLLGDLATAITCYHKALGFDPDDVFTVQMLTRALEETLEGGPPAPTSRDVNTSDSSSNMAF